MQSIQPDLRTCHSRYPFLQPGRRTKRCSFVLFTTPNHGEATISTLPESAKTSSSTFMACTKADKSSAGIKIHGQPPSRLFRAASLRLRHRPFICSCACLFSHILGFVFMFTNHPYTSAAFGRIAFTWPSNRQIIGSARNVARSCLDRSSLRGLLNAGPRSRVDMS